MKKLIIILFAIATYGSIISQTKAEAVTGYKTGWHKMGGMTVNFKKEKDEMIVMGADRFTSVKIKVTESDIYLADVEVYFENGAKQEISIKSIIKNGDESAVLALDGGPRNISKVAVVYKALAPSTSEKAHLEVWGSKASEKK